MNGDSTYLDLTEDGVHFASWKTGVENDSLSLRTLNLAEDRQLIATFSSKQKQQDVVFTFDQTEGFRVLDEGGLLELWAASKKNPRPAQATFRVRGHNWQKESPLAWIHGSEEPYFSYMIATDWDCLEVISLNPPHIELSSLSS